MDKDLLQEYKEDSEVEKLDLWLEHPELREEFDRLEHIARQIKQHTDELQDHPVNSTLHDLGHKLQQSAADLAERCLHALHLDKHKK
jgi:hypothetical protein